MPPSIPLVASVGACLLLAVILGYAQGIDYASHRYDSIPRSVAKLTTRHLLERINDAKHRRPSSSLQAGTEYLLQYGALLRIQILDAFGRLLYERYEDFSLVEVESLYRVYRETLERKYNVFDVVPALLNEPDPRPSRVCQHIHELVPGCLRESTEVCRRIRKHDEPRPDVFDVPARRVTLQVYRTAKIPELYPRGFSLPIVLKYLQRGKLELTAALLSGLLHNVRYDSFDDEVRSSERELVRYLADGGEQRQVEPPTAKELRSARTVGSLLKLYLRTRKVRFPARIRRDAELLAERIVGDVDLVSEDIHLLGNVYQNGTIRVDYLFGLVIPVDLVDPDVVEARDFLVGLMRKYDVVERFLSVDKYQQAAPDQLTMEIVGQLREIGFAVDIATALRAFARFWHRSRMIANLNDLLELFDAYENLRQVPKYAEMMRAIDRIRENLWDSRNVTVEMLCNSPRACLRLGLEIVLRCTHVNEATKDQVKKFLSNVTPQGALVDDECGLPMGENLTVRPDSRKTQVPTTAVATKTSPSTTTSVVTETPSTATPTTFASSTTDASSEEESDLPTLAATSTTESTGWDTESTTTYRDVTAESVDASAEFSSENEADRTTDATMEPTEATETAEPTETTEGETEATISAEDIPTATASTSSEHDMTIPSTTDSDRTRDFKSRPTETTTTKMRAPTTTLSPSTMSSSGKRCRTSDCSDEEHSEETLPSGNLHSTTSRMPTTSVESTETGDRTTGTETGSSTTAGSGTERCLGENCEASCGEDEDCPTTDCTGENCPTTGSPGDGADGGGGGGDEMETGQDVECREGEDCAEVVVNCDSDEASCVSSTDCSGEDCPATTDCSGEDCPANMDCSGEDCPPTTSATSSTTTAMTTPSDDVQSTKTDLDCALGQCETDGERKLDDCSGENCPDEATTDDGRVTSVVDGADCQGEDCPSAEDCTGADCPKKPQDETSCEGSACPTSKETFDASGEDGKTNASSSVYCENRDPDYQRKLGRLQKMMKISAMRAAELLAAGNSSRESGSDESPGFGAVGTMTRTRNVPVATVAPKKTLQIAEISVPKIPTRPQKTTYVSGRMPRISDDHGMNVKHATKFPETDASASLPSSGMKTRRQQKASTSSSFEERPTRIQKKSRARTSSSATSAMHGGKMKSVRAGHGKKPTTMLSEMMPGSDSRAGKMKMTRHEIPSGKMKMTRHEIPSGKMKMTRYEVPSGKMKMTRHEMPSGKTMMSRHEMPSGKTMMSRHEIPSGKTMMSRHEVPSGKTMMSRHEIPSGKMRASHSSMMPHKSMMGRHSRPGKMSRSYHRSSEEDDSGQSINIRNVNVNKQRVGTRKRATEKPIAARFGDVLPDGVVPTIYQSQTERIPRIPTRVLRDIARTPRKVRRARRRSSEMID